MANLQSLRNTCPVPQPCAPARLGSLQWGMFAWPTPKSAEGSKNIANQPLRVVCVVRRVPSSAVLHIPPSAEFAPIQRPASMILSFSCFRLRLLILVSSCQTESVPNVGDDRLIRCRHFCLHYVPDVCFVFDQPPNNFASSRRHRSSARDIKLSLRSGFIRDWCLAQNETRIAAMYAKSHSGTLPYCWSISRHDFASHCFHYSCSSIMTTFPRRRRALRLFILRVVPVLF